jgi:hypothetical protein
MTTTTATASERRAAALRQAAQAKRQAAVTRADTAIRKLIKTQQDINFRSVAGVGGCLQAGQDRVEAGAESLVAVVGGCPGCRDG